MQQNLTTSLKNSTMYYIKKMEGYYGFFNSFNKRGKRVS